MRRETFIVLAVVLLTMATIGCSKIGEILNSYPGLTLYFERASNGQPFSSVAANNVENGSSATSGESGKVTLRVGQQDESVEVHLEWQTLTPTEWRSKNLWFSLGKGDNYYEVILQDDPRRAYKLSAKGVTQEDKTLLDGETLIIPADVTGTIHVPDGVKTIIILL